MDLENAKLLVVIEIDARVEAETKAEVVAFMLERLAGMTIRGIDGTEDRKWQCAFSTVELVKDEE